MNATVLYIYNSYPTKYICRIWGYNLQDSRIKGIKSLRVYFNKLQDSKVKEIGS